MSHNSHLRITALLSDGCAWGRRCRSKLRRCAMSAAHVASSTRGVVFIHACPPAIGPHVEWALAGVLGRPCKLQWRAQPAATGQLRAEATWIGPIGMAARLSASLRAWPMLRFEVTEEGTGSTDGER